MHKCYNALILSFSLKSKCGKTAFSIVRQCENKSGLGRDAREAFHRLLQRFEPRTMIDKSAKLQEFHNKMMPAHSDPKEYLQDMEELRDEINNMGDDNVIITEQLFLNCVLNGLPPAYNTLVQVLQLNVDKTGEDQLTIFI